jgi:choice-of-anchor C domain-containing protein
MYKQQRSQLNLNKERLMKRSFIVVTIFITIALSLIGQRLYASSIANGSFEDGVDLNTGFITLNAGDTSIYNWTIGGDSVDYVGSFWTASAGDRSIDMSGLGAGTIEQTFDTDPGQWYKVTFDLAGNSGGSPSVKEMQASIDSGGSFFTESYTFDTTGQSVTDMGWITNELVFNAEGSTSTLRFSSLTGGGYGPALDNVTVSAVPLPFASVFMLSGLIGMAGFKRFIS